MACLAAITLVLGSGCGSSHGGAQLQPSDVPAGACRNAVLRYETLQHDLSVVLKDPSDSTVDRTANADAEQLKTAVAALTSRANGDQQALLSQFQAVVRDLESSLTSAANNSLTEAKSVLRGVATQLSGLTGLIQQVCKK